MRVREHERSSAPAAAAEAPSTTRQTRNSGLSLCLCRPPLLLPLPSFRLLCCGSLLPHENRKRVPELPSSTSPKAPRVRLSLSASRARAAFCFSHSVARPFARCPRCRHLARFARCESRRSNLLVSRLEPCRDSVSSVSKVRVRALSLLGRVGSSPSSSLIGWLIGWAIGLD